MVSLSPSGGIINLSNHSSVFPSHSTYSLKCCCTICCSFPCVELPGLSGNGSPVVWVNGRSDEGVDWLRMTRDAWICVWSRDVQPRHERRCCDWPFSCCSKGNVFPWLHAAGRHGCSGSRVNTNTGFIWKPLEADIRQCWEATALQYYICSSSRKQQCMQSSSGIMLKVRVLDSGSM